METTATFAKVKAAYDELRLENQRPSASKIVAMIGGSKTTVLAHLRSILEGEATSTTESDPGLAMLEASADTMTRKLWDQACRIAEQTYDSKLRSLMRDQASLFEDFQVAVRAEEDAIARAEYAETRLKSVEAELSAKTGLEDQIAALRALIGSVRKQPEIPAMSQLLIMLSSGRRKSKDDIYLRMAEIGYDSGKIHQARYHAVESEYVEELPPAGSGGTGFRLTAKGKSKLALDAKRRG